MNLFSRRKSFLKELKRQFRMAIVAAIGFTIAFGWRNAIFGALENFVSRFLDIAPGHYLTELYTAMFLTLLGVILLFMTSNLLKD